MFDEKAAKPIFPQESRSFGGGLIDVTNVTFKEVELNGDTLKIPFSGVAVISPDPNPLIAEQGIVDGEFIFYGVKECWQVFCREGEQGWSEPERIVFLNQHEDKAAGAPVQLRYLAAGKLASPVGAENIGLFIRCKSAVVKGYSDCSSRSVTTVSLDELEKLSETM